MNIVKLLKKNSPTILTVLGAIGVVGTAIMTAKAVPKAMKLVEEAEKEKGEELSKWETIQVAAPTYIPSILLGTGTLVCIFGANILNKRSQASLASAYALLDQSYKEYRSKLKELYGEEAHKNIIDSIALDYAENVSITCGSCYGLNTCDLSVEENDGKPRLFYDAFSKRYFEKTIEQVLNAEYHINRNCILRGEVTVNEFYDFLGLNHIDGGDDLIWFPCDDFLWIDFNHRKVQLEDGLQCYIIEMMFEPMLEEEYDLYINYRE